MPRLFSLTLFLACTSGSLFDDPSLSTSAASSLTRIATVLTGGLVRESLHPLSPATLLPSLTHALYTGEAVHLPLGTPGHAPDPLHPAAVLVLQLSSTALGSLLHALRCDAGWGAGCGGAASAPGSPPAAPPPAPSAQHLVQHYREDASASQRLRQALWSRRMEFCEAADLLAPGALALHLAASLPLRPPPPPPAQQHSDFAGSASAAHSLSACALRRLRNAGGSVAGLVNAEGAMVPTRQESLLYLLLGGSPQQQQQQQQPACTIVAGFDSAVLRFLAAGNATPSPAAPAALPSISKRGLFVFSSEEDLAGSVQAEAPAAVPTTSTPPPATIWHALLLDLQALRATSPASIQLEDYAPGLLTVVSSSPPATWQLPSFLPQCTQDAPLAAMLTALSAQCRLGALPPPSEALAIELLRHTSRLMLAGLLAGDGEELDLGACLQSSASASASAAASSPLPLVFCLPTSLSASSLCPPSAVWGSPRSHLVPYWHDLSATTATLLLTHPRVATSLRTLLHYSLAVGDIAGWHPSGITPPHAPDLLFSPQHMFYFASSYFFVHLEKEYKRQLHDRMAGALRRLGSYESTQHLLVGATALLGRMSRFDFEADAAKARVVVGAAREAQGDVASLTAALAAAAAEHTAGRASRGAPALPPPSLPIHGRGIGAACASAASPRLLVLSSYWDKGHSSHRITAPLSRALAAYTCAYLVHAVNEDVWELTRTGAASISNASESERAQALAAARSRYEDSAGFADVESYPVGESLPLQLALWALLRSHSQLNGSAPGLAPLPVPTPEHPPAMVDSEFLALGKEEEGSSTPTPPAPHPLPFHAVLYPSVGMSPNDMTLSSLRLAPLQMVTYGHSSSSQSPAMDLFLGGVEPEVLGPVTADVYALSTACTAGVEALAALLQVALKEGGELGAEGLVGGTARTSPLRLPRVAVCSGTSAILGAWLPGPLNASTLAAPVNQVCSTLNAYGVATAGPLGSLSVPALLPSLLPASAPPLSPRCRTSFPLHTPAAPALYTRLVDAQRRYSERLLLLPGLGLWFTSVFPTYAPPLRVLPNTSSPALAAPWGRRGLHLGAALLGVLLGEEGQGGSPGAQEGGLEAHTLLLAALQENALPALLEALAGVLAEGSIPWPGASPQQPVEISLVWSVVKWNGRHLDRLLVSLHAAQARFSAAWGKCASASASASGAGAGLEAYARLLPPAPATTPPLSPPLAAAFTAAAAASLRAVCESLLGAYPPAPPPAPPTTTPPLFFTIVAFSTSDGDALKGAAFRAWLRRLLLAEFPGGLCSLQFITNATTPSAYYGRLGRTHLAFDSLPFSACNTMQDVVALRVPTISSAHDGEYEPGSGTALRWRSSIGACMLSRLGLSGLAAEGEGDLVGKASHLIANPLLRAAWKLRMHEADEGELSRHQYSDRDAQIVANLVKRVAAGVEEV